MRLSPQDIDREVNEGLDQDPLFSAFSVGTLGAASTWTQKPPKKPHEGRTYQKPHKNRHGWCPGLDDLERMYA